MGETFHQQQHGCLEQVTIDSVSETVCSCIPDQLYMEESGVPEKKVSLLGGILWNIHQYELGHLC